jgi:hypothetical protein
MLVTTVGVVAIGVAGLAGASPLLIVTCAAPKGVNVAAATESDKPKASVSVGEIKLLGAADNQPT